MKTEELFKLVASFIFGITATFFKQYGLLIALVSLAVVLDFATGVIKAKVVGEGLDSTIARRGFWRKMALFVALSFGFLLDLMSGYLFVKVGVNISAETPFALIVASYIVLNESISIAENLYQINPNSMPDFVIKLLKVAKNNNNKLK